MRACRHFLYEGGGGAQAQKKSPPKDKKAPIKRKKTTKKGEKGRKSLHMAKRHFIQNTFLVVINISFINRLKHKDL